MYTYYCHLYTFSGLNDTMKPNIILKHLRSQISCLVIIPNWYLAKNVYCCVVVVHWIDWKDNERRPVEKIRRHRNLRLSLLKWMCVKIMRPENVFFFIHNNNFHITQDNILYLMMSSKTLWWTFLVRIIINLKTWYESDMFLGKMCKSLFATKINPSLKLLITENTIFTCITSRIIQENAVLTK